MKFITRGTIEESILNMSTMKLKLDKKISSEDKKEIEPTESSSTNMEIDSNEDSESSDKSNYILFEFFFFFFFFWFNFY